MNKFKLSALALAMGLGISSNAFALTSINDSLVDGVNTWSDDSGELFLDLDNNGTVTQGDQFVSVLGFTSFPTATPTGASTYNELTGLFAIEVTNNPVAVDFSCGGDLVCGGMTFGAVADMNATLATAATEFGLTAFPTYTNLDGSALTAGTGILFFEDTTHNYIRDTAPDLATAFDTAIDGTMVMTAGLFGGASSLSGLLPLDPTGLASVAAGTGIGSITGEFTIFDEIFASYDFNPTITVTGNLSGTQGSTSPFGIHDDISMTLTATKVPEPSTIALIGLGLLGMAGASRKKKGFQA